jgi:hypothetical protein
MKSIFKFIVFVLLIGPIGTSAQNPFLVYSGDEARKVGYFSDYVLNEHDSLGAWINDADFVPSDRDVLNFQSNQNYLWLRTTIKNQSNSDELSLVVNQADINLIRVYKSRPDGYEMIYESGQNYKFHQRDVKNPMFVSNIQIPVGKKNTYLVQIKNDETLAAPVFVMTRSRVDKRSIRMSLFWGIYAGVMAAMFIYNLFIYFSLRDNLYLLYVVQLAVIFLIQSNLLGYAYQHFWPNLPSFANFMNYALTGLASFFGLWFAQRFLNTKDHYPRINLVLSGIRYAALLLILVSLTPMKAHAYQPMLALSGISAFLVLFVSADLYFRKKSRAAGFYLLAWSLFLIGVFAFSLKDMGTLPYNNFTNYSIVVGSALETVLISFALADRINTLKREKEASQRDAISQMLKNEELITNQNIELERNVEERTKELNQTIETLKETQDKLIEAEKMASLGQLTSGVAHEINNPINFVSSSIGPLRQDIDDLKHLLNKYQSIQEEPQEVWDQKFDEIQKEAKRLDIPYTLSEIDELLKGITEGARRTSEIVKGLGSFSRSDKTKMEPNDINAGVDATVSIIKTQLKGIKLEVEKGDLPLVECQIGKINQVVMNTLNNAIHAIEERYDNPLDGVISVRTYREADDVIIEISDNGSGIKESIQKDLFNPFFTTKEVGKGTGLGLSISYGIVDQHNGSITFESEENKGTTFSIRIPIFYVERNEEEEELS